MAVRRPLYRAKWTRHTLLMTTAHAGGALGPALLGLGPIHPPRRLYYHPDAVDALVLHVPRAQNMTARRKCDPDAWTGVLVQPLRASAWNGVGASPAVDPASHAVASRSAPVSD